MLNNPKETKFVIDGKEVIITTGAMAKQANGSVTLRCGNTVLLATATMSKEPKDGIDFFPLTIEFMEKMYASGKIPGGFFKREARPTTEATLTARLIDRPLRPSFPKGLFNEVQIVVTVLSYDPLISLEPLSIVAASAAVQISDIPFNAPVGAALIGYVDGKYIINPSKEELEFSELEIVVAGTKDAILMIEAGASEVSEGVIIKAISTAHEVIKETIRAQEDLSSKAGKEKIVLAPKEPDAELKAKIIAALGTQIEDNLQSGNKSEIETFLRDLEATIIDKFSSKEDTIEPTESDVRSLFNSIKKDQIRKTIITKKIRPDGRRTDEIRPIEIEVGVLPNAHGSSLFTRGETQSLGVVTLGTGIDEQLIDGLEDSNKKTYFFHYNFPPYSVGECGFVGRTGRRELGHGALAERALLGVLPKHQEFPYTTRIVSEILESNGSSSMASVCSGSMALMDCGVPVSGQVSGIAMGLLMSDDGYTILSDIQGLEDHYGDMDFKVAGTEKGITALQLDIKIAGLSDEILTKSLEQARQGRLHILDKMNAAISAPRTSLSDNAPQIEMIKINPDKVGLVIGPGGKMIKKIEEDSGAAVYVTDGDKGEVSISAKSSKSLQLAKSIITALVKEIEVGEVYDGKVVKTTNFGAFVELLPGKEGLIHISKLSRERIENVEDVVKTGDPIKVKVNAIDNQNRINLVPVLDV